MKRYTVPTDASGLAAWNSYYAPRGRVLAISLTNRTLRVGGVNNPMVISFVGQNLYPGITLTVSNQAREAQVVHLDEICSGRVHVYTLVGSLDAHITLWYADEDTKFAMEV